MTQWERLFTAPPPERVHLRLAERFSTRRGLRRSGEARLGHVTWRGRPFRSPERDPLRRLSPLVAVVLLLLVGGLAPRPAGADLAPAREWIVGFEALPPGVAVGGEYAGGVVQRVNPSLRSIAVSSADPAFKALAFDEATVRYVEPQGTYRILFEPNDPRHGDQYEQKQVRLPAAWDVTLGSTAGKVCVVDTGVRYTHEDLRGRFLGGWDFVNGDADPMDDHGHGTHVAGIAAAGVHNGVGGTGAGNVGYYAVKVMDENGRGEWSDVADGIAWCADHGGPDTVVSVSIGGGYSREVDEAIRYAYHGKGMLVVAAAGNDGPCADCVAYPARLPEVVSVACTAKGETLCAYSSSGAQAGIAAPGDRILNACHDHDSQYCSRSGTSDSAPLVSGIAALYWSHDPSLTNVQLRERLLRTAQDLGRGGWDRDFGHGEVDAKCLFEDRSPCLPPPNDELARAEPIDDLPFRKDVSTRLATTALAEPRPCGPAGATVWYRWTAPGSGPVTAESMGAGFDTVLAAYAGDNLTSLAPLACSADDAQGGSARSRVRFDATAGMTYTFQLGGLGGASGTAHLRVSCAGCPENNAFADAAPIPAVPFSARQSTQGATVEPREPAPCGATTTGTVWYRWVAPGSGNVTFDTFGSRYDTVLAVHAGTAPGSLAQVACSDDAAGSRQSAVTFRARVGTTYHVQVAGRWDAAGDLQLSVQCPECVLGPPHDAFATPKVVAGIGYHDEVGTLAATAEPGEPQPCGLIGRTVWYSVTPQYDSRAIFRTAGSDYDTVLAAYRGDELSNLTLMKCLDDVQGGRDLTSIAVFDMKAGVTYRVQAGGFDGATGALRLTFECTPLCFDRGQTNDMRANATPIPALPYVNQQYNNAFTTEPGETRPPYMGATAWYRYTHPAGAQARVVTVDTEGSGIDAVLAVYLADTYVPLAYNQDEHEGTKVARVRFTALPGVAYAIQLGGATSGATAAMGLLQVNAA